MRRSPGTEPADTQGRQDLFGLVQMNTKLTSDYCSLRTALTQAQRNYSAEHVQRVAAENKSNWELMAKDKLISELYSKIKVLRAVRGL